MSGCTKIRALSESSSGKRIQPPIIRLTLSLNTGEKERGVTEFRKLMPMVVPSGIHENFLKPSSAVKPKLAPCSGSTVAFVPIHACVNRGSPRRSLFWANSAEEIKLTRTIRRKHFLISLIFGKKIYNFQRRAALFEKKTLNQFGRSFKSHLTSETPSQGKRPPTAPVQNRRSVPEG